MSATTEDDGATEVPLSSPDRVPAFHARESLARQCRS
jgi:hypothetical protein